MDETGLIAAVTPVLIEHEGEKFTVYKDSLGIPTIGVGFNLTRHDAPYLCQQCGADYGSLLSGANQLTQAQSRWLLQRCIIEVLEWETALFPSFDAFSQPRQVGLVDMGFELGETRFRGFKQMITCILQGNWWVAADQALHSQWASEVPTRATYDAGLLRAG